MGEFFAHRLAGFKRKVLTVAGCVGLLIFISLVSFQILLPFDNPEFTVMGTGSSSTSGLMLLMGPLFSCWAFSIAARCPDAYIRRRFVAIAGLLAMWMLLVLIKYPSRNDLFSSICWYLYYVPMIFVPALCFSSSLRAVCVENIVAGLVSRKVVLFISIALVFFILTNNFHQQVFDFNFADVGWSGNYSYNWGYWLVLFWILGLYGSFFVLIVPASKNRLRPAFIPIIIIAIVAVSYCFLYVFRQYFLFKTNIALVYSVLVLVAIELSLDFGIFPSYLHYDEAFYALPFNVKLFSKDKKMQFSTKEADVSPVVSENVVSALASSDSITSCLDNNNSNIMIRSFPITGGTAVSTIDVGAINKRRQELKAKQNQLYLHKEVLERVQATRKLLALNDCKQSLVSAIERSLHDIFLKIEELVKNLPASDSPDDIQRRREVLEQVKFLTAYCKRKGNLVISAHKDHVFNLGQMQLLLHEITSDFSSLGIDSAAFVEINESLPVESVTFIYDFIYGFSRLAFDAKVSALMIFIKQRQANDIELRLAFETFSSSCSNNLARSFQLLTAQLKTAHVFVEVTEEEHEVIVILKLPSSFLNDIDISQIVTVAGHVESGGKDVTCCDGKINDSTFCSADKKMRGE